MKSSRSSARFLVYIGLIGLGSVAGSCSKSSPPAASTCTASATPMQNTLAGPTGVAMIFNPDPATSSGNTSISPNSLTLDQYAQKASLSNLNGNGVLSGSYVDVRNGLACNDGYGAFDISNNFQYGHKNTHFAETMTYFWGDKYRSTLPAALLQPKAPVKMIAHCMQQDNAYFIREMSGTTITDQYVCLGDSQVKPGATFADDATVPVHELEHATTMNSYSLTQDLNQFRYDEAGSLNEAVSDFMSLVHLDQLESAFNFDDRVFSRWALGMIFSTNSERGANQCPLYSAGYPNCAAFGSAAPFSGASNTLSYIYPDGMGWPYTSPVSSLYNVYSGFTSQEEIHNAAVLMEGALWDVYTVLKNANGETLAQTTVTQVVLTAMNPLALNAHPIPLPDGNNLSPVTYPGFAAAVLESCQHDSICAQSSAAVLQALTARGLIGNTVPDANWIAVGTGTSATPGMAVVDNPGTLAQWFPQFTTDTALAHLKQSTNARLDPGDVAAIWFDIANTSAITVGGPLVTVTSNNGHVTFLSDKYGNPMNEGPMSTSQVQVRYIKINGTKIKAALGFSGTSYFLTNPSYSSDWTTAIFVRVDSAAAHGETASFTVSVQPSNGPTNSTTFTTQIN